MVVDPKLAARLRALQRGRAQRCATHLRVTVQHHALVVAPIAMAGEDRIHAVGFGALDEPPEVLCVPDPRKRDDEYALLRRFGATLERYYRECREAGTHPQIWVSSRAGAALLDGLAERSRYARPGRGDDEAHVEEVRRFGTLLSYATDRYPYAGQQALLTATEALSAHFATGQEESEDEHLGALLCWIEPPEGEDVLAAVARAERIPMGVKTDPEFDKDVLEPLVHAYNESLREGASDRVLAVRVAAVERALAPEAERVYAAVQRSVRLLREAGMPQLPALDDLVRREAEEFEDFMGSRDDGYFLTLRDRPKAAAFKLSAREDAEQNYEAAVMVGDGIARAQGRMSGRIVRGIAENPRSERVAPRRFRYFFDLVSDQRVLRVRRGDELRLLDGRTFKVVVLDIAREGETTRLSVELVEGMRAVGLPVTGEELELTSRLPDWGHIWRERGHLRTRLARTPWTHSEDRPPAARLRQIPADPLAEVEALR
jgi:hypothetical protein